MTFSPSVAGNALGRGSYGLFSIPPGRTGRACQRAPARNPPARPTPPNPARHPTTFCRPARDIQEFGPASEGRGELGKETPSTLLGASRAGALRARARLDNEAFNIGTAMPRRGGASSEKGTPTTLLGASRVGAPRALAGADSYNAHHHHH